MGILNKTGNAIKNTWNYLNSLDYPDCPACKGTGKPTHPYEVWADSVYWMGEIVHVCHNCKGRGKV